MIAALMLARNESWCLGLTLRAASLYCDAVVFTDHRSDDATPDIVKQVASETGLRIDYLRDESTTWNEMDARQEQLLRARKLGATHMAIVDADELPTFNVAVGGRSLIESVPPGRAGALPMVATYHDAHTRRVDGSWGRASRLTWCFHDTPSVQGWASDAGYHHHMRTPRGCPSPPDYIVGYEHGRVDLGWGGVFHLQFISKKRLIEKAVWYKIMETIKYPGRMSAAQLNAKYDWTLVDWDGSPDSTPPETVQVPSAWWRGYIDLGWHTYLRPQDESWQARDARALYVEHVKANPHAFNGIKTYGVLDLLNESNNRV